MDGVSEHSFEVPRRQFIAGIGAGVGLAMAADAGLFSPRLLAAASVPTGATRFVPLPMQVRLADTRKPPDGEYPYEVVDAESGQHIRVRVIGRAGVPTTATAAVFTVTAVNRATTNYITAFPSGPSVPVVSTLNMARRGEVAANLATIKLGAGGMIDVLSKYEAKLIVDIAGYYEAVDMPVRAGRYVGLDSPERILDSRNGGAAVPGREAIVEVPLDRRVPEHATAVAINLTTTKTLGWGYLSCVPFGSTDMPSTSNLNVDGVMQTRAAAAVVRVGESSGTRGFSVMTSGGGHIIVDLVGYYTGDEADESSDGLFVPADPVRIVDTRNPTPARLWRNWMLESTVPGRAATDASSVVVNVTAVDALGPGYVSMLPARSFRWTPSVRPSTSSVNHTVRGQTVANQVVCRVTDTYGISAYASEGCHLLIDYSGYFTGRPRQPTVGAPSNPPPQSTGPEWRLRIPKIGHLSTVRDGNSIEVTDSGDTWHWSGTGNMGDVANVALFAHRTAAGGPFYNLHLLAHGDRVEVVTSDRRVFEYEVASRRLTTNDRDDILNAARSVDAPSVALIACTYRNYLPSSLAYRIVVLAKLVRWYEW